MKKKNILGLLCIACLSLAGCQQLDEPDNTVPVVQTPDVTEVGATYAYLPRIEIKSNSYIGASFYYLSTASDMSNTTYAEANSQCTGLTPNTTYYYRACAADSRDLEDVLTCFSYGEVKSFTTLSTHVIGNVTYADWDNTTQSGAIEGATLGLGLQGSNLTDYQTVTYNGSAWSWEEDVSAGTMTTAYAYYPYNADQYYYEGVDLLGISSDYNPSTANLYYGYSTVNSDQATFDFHMQPAMARVIFHLSISENNERDTVVAGNLQLDGSSDKVLPTWGILSLETGNFVNYGYGVFYYPEEFEFSKSTPVDVTLYCIPTVSAGIITLSVPMDNGSTLSADIEITSDGWQKGHTYTYDVEVNNSLLQISNTNTTIAGWDDGGTSDPIEY